MKISLVNRVATQRIVIEDSARECRINQLSLLCGIMRIINLTRLTLRLCKIGSSQQHVLPVQLSWPKVGA